MGIPYSIRMELLWCIWGGGESEFSHGVAPPYRVGPTLSIIRFPIYPTKFSTGISSEPKVKPRVGYWVSEDLPHKRRKSLPGLSILDVCHRVFVAQNGVANFLIYSGCDVIFKVKAVDGSANCVATDCVAIDYVTFYRQKKGK